MPNFDFDKVERRAYQQPQTTKHELLRPPTHGASQSLNTEWYTPRGASGLSDLLSNQSTWNFNNVDNLPTTHNHVATPVKAETEPSAAMAEKRLRNSDMNHGPSKKIPPKISNGANLSTSFGGGATGDQDDELGVIDLTSDVEENEEQPVFPERQFVPRADDDTSAPNPARRRSRSPPRTFTRGFSPIAAHPRKPPIVHKSKPPIKPADRKRRKVIHSPSAPSHQVFRSRSVSMSAAGPAVSRSSTPVARSTPAVALDATSSKEPPTTVTSNSDRVLKSGPFLQGDDSSDDEHIPLDARSVPRDSLENLVGCPKRDTPARDGLIRLQNESKLMRANAQQKTHKGPETPATYSNAIPNARGLGANNTHHSPEQSFLGRPHQRKGI